MLIDNILPHKPQCFIDGYYFYFINLILIYNLLFSSYSMKITQYFDYLLAPE
jgi:hypothetical protein